MVRMGAVEFENFGIPIKIILTEPMKNAFDFNNIAELQTHFNFESHYCIKSTKRTKYKRVLLFPNH